jgi:phosphatidylglycerol:prolipoprotein diacylglycerol transferase
MHPLLFHVGSVPIHTYGALIALGFLVAVAVIRWLAIRSKVDSDAVLDLVFWTFIVGFIGSRLLYIVTQWSEFAADPMAAFRVWEGGLVFLGGPLAAAPFAIWMLNRKKMPVWKVGDCLLPGLAIAHAFGRLGCLGAGCCYGKPTGTDFGIILNTDRVEAALRGVHLHPTQLYEFTALTVLFIGLIWIFFKKRFDGQVVLSYFIAYPVIRSIVEIYRGDMIRGFLIGDWLSTSQFISGLIFIAAIGFLIKRLKEVGAHNVR